jgi:nitroimidazol reductase NimA-like FMN-containing flavoprotein (pyridoxamine 5'-phosphate oxidase superfamily)
MTRSKASARSEGEQPRKAKQPVELAGALGTSPPHITAMSEAACHALLQRHAVGRMAYSFHDRVDITPIHYVFADGWLFARTSHGAKMTTIEHAPWVAFEVDEIDSVFEWRSVVVHGTAHVMPRDGSPLDTEHWRRGVELLRRIVPATGTEDDPVPYRTLVFGIFVDSITGRASTTRG